MRRRSHTIVGPGWAKVLNWTILQRPEADGRESHAALAERVSLSKTPCWTRVQALERAGAIHGHRAVVDPHAVGLKLTAFAEMTIEFGSRVPFERAGRGNPAIIECYTTAGEAAA